MQLPHELQLAIEEMVEKTPPHVLKKARAALSSDYKTGKSSPLNDEEKWLSYLITRMPATYAAILKVLQNIPFPVQHFLDLGSGPATASWAAFELFPSLQKITCVERSQNAIELGKKLSENHPFLKSIQWHHQSLSDPLPQADLAIFSYVLNEVADPWSILDRCWEIASTLVIIEPGTPKGFELIRKARQKLIDGKAHIIAPCPKTTPCPMQGSDWCHFPARVERTRLHRLLKEGTLGHEDEKFSYLIASKQPALPFSARIVRHPQKNSGHVRLKLCTGIIEERVVTKQGKELYRKARHAEWGDVWQM